MADPVVYGATFTAVTGVFALDNGHAQISGHSELGTTEFEIPGNCVPMLIAGLSGILPNLPSGSKDGLTTVFVVNRAKVEASETPGYARLVLTCEPNTDMKFSLPLSVLEQAGHQLIQIAEQERERQGHSPTKPQ